jgi:hypothetical protein
VIDFADSHRLFGLLPSHGQVGGTEVQKAARPQIAFRETPVTSKPRNCPAANPAAPTHPDNLFRVIHPGRQVVFCVRNSHDFRESAGRLTATKTKVIEFHGFITLSRTSTWTKPN